MAEHEYAVVFQGRIAEGADAAVVRANLARLFNADAARIEKMFSGNKVVIKKGLDAEAAAKYKAALGKAGALVEIARIGTPTGAPPAPTAVPPAASAPTESAAPSSARTVPPAAPPPQTVPAAFAAAASPPAALETTLAEAGAILVTHQAVTPPEIATDHLSVAEVGVTLIEAERIPEPRFNLDDLSLDPPGVTLAEAKPVAPPEYAFEGLSLDEHD